MVMKKIVLIIEDDDRIRAALGKALRKSGFLTLSVKDIMDGMSALGRAAFDMVVVSSAQRKLALCGLCQLAQRRHPQIRILILAPETRERTFLQNKLACQVYFLDDKIERSVLLHHIKKIFLLHPPEKQIPTIQEMAIDPIIDEKKNVPETSSPMPGDAPEPLVETVGITSDAESGDIPDLSPPLKDAGFQIDPLAVSVAAEGASGISGSSEGSSIHSPPQTINAEIGKKDDPENDFATAVLWSGEIENANMASVLTTIAVQQLTGRFEVTKESGVRSYFFLGGEPVWFDSADREESIWASLQKSENLPQAWRGRERPEGLLLPLLVNLNIMPGHALHAFLVSFFRGEVLALLRLGAGGYVFYDDQKFIGDVPLLKLNLFGLILQSYRDQHSPVEVLRQGDEIEWQYVLARPALVPASVLLKPFCRGLNLGAIVNGRRTMRQLVRKMEIDPLLGAMLFLALRKAKLIEFQDRAAVDENNVPLAETTGISFHDNRVPHSDIQEEIKSTSQEDLAARDEIFSLYMRMKTLEHPYDVLGISKGASAEEMEHSFKHLLAQLSDDQVPAGSLQPLLLSRLFEIRKKVEWAYQLLRDG